MEHQDPVKRSWRKCLCCQRQVEFGGMVKRHEIANEVKGSSVQLEEQSDIYWDLWTSVEPARVKNCNGRSFAMDARKRLDSLKSGCNSPQPWDSSDSPLYYYDREKDLWDGEDPEVEQSALDVVDILDLEGNLEDEEIWLYEPPNKQSFEKDSALRWCRHVLDNPSPEMEAARRGLMKSLHGRSSYYLYRHAPVVTHSSRGCWEKTSVNTSLNDSDGLDPDKDYRLQDITDVHIMAKIQENSLRQEYISLPAVALLKRNPDMFSSFSNSEVDHSDDFSPRIKNSVPGFPCNPDPAAVGSPSCRLPVPAAKEGCQSPKLTKLHQQVTQFKLLRLAQSKASSGRTRSPRQTSLRSLQAVRNSRSLEVDDYQPAGKTSQHPPAPGYGFASLNSSSGTDLLRDSERITAMRRQFRSQSLSPSRPHPSKGYLPVRGRVFASQESPTKAAWGRHASSTQR
ncbi:SLAIN motif-containing protein-like [Cyprinodon tularosa]|uniref:SLAIN motif-containing protein-like n=1 Tax=Cyprinodon tularosa TaxID=77115 RepID=UPI0018E2001A|nr:SLAIN motif-containing protein-like [Cyprinodon tularosa]